MPQEDPVATSTKDQRSIQGDEEVAVVQQRRVRVHGEASDGHATAGGHVSWTSPVHVGRTLCVPVDNLHLGQLGI